MTRRPGPTTGERWEDFLDPGERLLWQGGPARGLRVTPAMIGLSVFGLPFLGAGLGIFVFGLMQLIGESGMAGAGVGLFLIAFSLPFVGVGGLMVLGVWFRAGLAHRHIRYALSNRRAYVATTWWKRSLQSYPIDPDAALELERGRNDSVWFRTEAHSKGENGTTRVGFENIADGDAVYALLRRIQRGEA